MIRNILISLLTLFINNLYSQKINQDFKIHPKKISQKIKIEFMDASGKKKTLVIEYQ